jgi:hypothetical protein
MIRCMVSKNYGRSPMHRESSAVTAAKKSFSDLKCRAAVKYSSSPQALGEPADLMSKRKGHLRTANVQNTNSNKRVRLAERLTLFI